MRNKNKHRFWKKPNIKHTSGQPVLRRECLGGHQSPPGSTEAIAFSHKSESWLLILSVSIVNPPPRINRGNHLFMRKWKLTFDLLHINHRSIPAQDQQRWLPFHAKVKVHCWSSLHWSSTPQDQQCWSPLCWLLIIRGRLSIDHPHLHF